MKLKYKQTLAIEALEDLGREAPSVIVYGGAA